MSADGSWNHRTSANKVIRPQSPKSQVVAYDQLVHLDAAPIIALNRGIAVAEPDGPEVALAAVDRLEGKLASYHAFHATRAGLLRRLGRSQESRGPRTMPSSWPATRPKPPT